MKLFSGFKFLGTGSCFNTKFGNNSAYYFNTSTNTLLLIDCGESVFERLCKLKVFNEAQAIDVLITHLHSDHVGSLPSLIFYCKFVKNITPTIIFPNHEIITQFLTLTGVEREFYNLKAVPSISDVRKNPQTCTVAYIKQRHKENIEAYGYIISIDERLIYYSGDSSTIDTNILYSLHSGGFDYFYQDVTRFNNGVHMNINNLAKAVPVQIRKNVTCMHFDDKKTRKLAKSLGFRVAK